MERDEIIKTINEVLVEEFEVEGSKIQPAADFRESLGLDSLDYVDLVVVIEEKFGVKLVEADFKPIVTFDDFYATLERKSMESKETSKTKWQGKSKGNVLGYRIFVFLIKHLGVRSAYLLLVFVALYYFLSQWTSNGYLYRYFRHRLGYTPLRAVVSVYRNYYVFGQTIIDKIAIFSNLRHRFTYEFDGQEQLHKLLALHKGGVLISAHIGNFEVAEPFFREIDVECQIHTVTTDMERSAIKEYLESVSLKEYTPKFIFVKEDMSHIFEIHQALQDNGIICFTGDRYFRGD